MRRQLRPTRNFAALALVALAALATAPASAQLVFNDGTIHTVNGAVPSGVQIRDGGGGAATTVNVEAPANISTTGGSSISVFDTSHLNMTGGTLSDELFLFNNATATVSGGLITDDITTNDNSSVTVVDVTNNDDLEARGHSVMNIQGGSHDEDIESFEFATVNITGGNFQTGADGAFVEAAGSSVVNIHGGSFGVGDTDGVGGINAIETGTVNIFGGDVGGLPQGLSASGQGVINVYGVGTQPTGTTALFDGVINVYNGAITALTATGDGDYNVFGIAGMTSVRAEGTSTINVYGTAFLVNGAPRAFGPLTTAAGSLSDGGTTVSFFRSFSTGATINLVQIPEPATAGLALAALAGLGVARRRNG